MIAVFTQIQHLLEFDSDDDFYYLQVIQRKKENPHLGSNSRVIKNYYIESVEYLEERYQEIITLCDKFNARAMLRLNKRSKRQVAFETLKLTTEHIYTGNYGFIRKSYDRACGRFPKKKLYWILDVDISNLDQATIDEITSAVEQCDPIKETKKYIVTLPTKNGIHIITTPFNVAQMREKIQFLPFGIDIHKDNPINLYIP